LDEAAPPWGLYRSEIGAGNVADARKDGESRMSAFNTLLQRAAATMLFGNTFVQSSAAAAEQQIVSRPKVACAAVRGRGIRDHLRIKRYLD
jgi:hypothetical protein